jgi:valyl-tRNA synthetase
MQNEFQKKYEPESFEKIIYSNWEKNGFFKPRVTTT